MTKPLWAPWRLEYIQQADELEGCVFCLAAAGDDEETLVVHRGEHAFVLLNRFPYASGHLMVAPYRHVGEFGEPRPTRRRWRLHRLAEQGDGRAGRDVRARRATTSAGTSAGSPARAIVDHVHLHVVPRWAGRHELHAGARRREGAAGAPERDAARSSPPPGRARSPRATERAPRRPARSARCARRAPPSPARVVATLRCVAPRARHSSASRRQSSGVPCGDADPPLDPDRPRGSARPPPPRPGTAPSSPATRPRADAAGSSRRRAAPSGGSRPRRSRRSRSGSAAAPAAG